GGGYLWSRGYGGSRGEIAGAVAVDSNDGIFIAGSMESSTVDIGGTVLTNAHNGGTNDLFVARLDSLGAEQWASNYGDSTDQCLVLTPCVSLAVDSADNLWLAGGMAGTVSFGGPSLPEGSDADAVVAKLSNAGATLWEGRFGDAERQYVAALAVTPSDHVVATGAYVGAVDFDSGPLPTSTYANGYVARFDENGIGQAAMALPSSYGASGRGVAVDANGNVTVLGHFGSPSGGTVTLDGSTTLTCTGGFDLFVAKYAADETLLWGYRFGDGYDEIGTALELDDEGNPLLTGYYKGTLTLGATPLPNAGGSYDDVFLAKLRR
ncbi:MAG: hypothetical protein JRI23_28105, partial [Deltaproteobacteria bacterium]|nr:hypothetical protein [Deltaproteobacteria bacterium]MBW2535955.1 hypothetical protein [Deltaproteobacteria bacterium]